MRILSVLVKLYDHLSLAAPTPTTPSNEYFALLESTRAELSALTQHRQDLISPPTNAATLTNAWNEIREVEAIIVGVERAVLAALRMRTEKS